MKYLIILIYLFSLNLNEYYYNRITLKDVQLEINSKNKINYNLYIKNTSPDTIKYKIYIWKGDTWYFKHSLSLNPYKYKYYDNAFVCDDKKNFSIELIKMN